MRRRSMVWITSCTWHISSILTLDTLCMMLVDLKEGTETTKLEDSQVVNLFRFDRPALTAPK